MYEPINKGLAVCFAGSKPFAFFGRKYFPKKAFSVPEGCFEHPRYLYEC